MNDVRKLIRLKEVQEMVGLSSSSIYNRMSAGTFPKQKSIGDRAVAWQESDIDAWMDAHGCTEQPEHVERPPAEKIEKKSVTKSVKADKPDDPLVFTLSSDGTLTIKSFNTVLTLKKKEVKALERFFIQYSDN